jgi:pyruvate,water dikinase
VDLSAGLAFGLTNVGNALVLALDASAGEIQLLQFINNTRHFLERTAVDVPMKRWFQLQVTVSGREVSCALDGRSRLRFAASRPVTGYIGLWSKGDTTAYFRDLETGD